MDLDKVRELIGIFEASKLSEMELEEEGLRMRLKKSRPKTVASPGIPIAAPQIEYGGQAVGQVTPGHAEPSEAEEDNLVTINSPMVGTFYAAPAPGEPAFVSPGDSVDENQTVCVVEAMKLMNEVTAKFPAVVEKVLVENGEPVEFGQPLFAVRPIEQV